MNAPFGRREWRELLRWENIWYLSVVGTILAQERPWHISRMVSLVVRDFTWEQVSSREDWQFETYFSSARLASVIREEGSRGIASPKVESAFHKALVFVAPSKRQDTASTWYISASLQFVGYELCRNGCL